MSNSEQYQLPPNGVFQHMSKLAIVEDKPIMLDYWIDSLNATDSSVIIGVKENNEKILVKNVDEYTSPIGKIYKVEGCYICITENSIYLVSANIKTKRVT